MTIPQILSEILNSLSIDDQLKEIVFITDSKVINMYKINLPIRYEVSKNKFKENSFGTTELIQGEIDVVYFNKNNSEFVIKPLLIKQILENEK